MKCSKCGAKLSNDAKFCNKCGTPVPEVSDTNKYVKWSWIIVFLVILIVGIGSGIWYYQRTQAISRANYQLTQLTRKVNSSSRRVAKQWADKEAGAVKVIGAKDTIKSSQQSYKTGLKTLTKINVVTNEQKIKLKQLRISLKKLNTATKRLDRAESAITATNALFSTPVISGTQDIDDINLLRGLTVEQINAVSSKGLPKKLAKRIEMFKKFAKDRMVINKTITAKLDRIWFHGNIKSNATEADLTDFLASLTTDNGQAVASQYSTEKAAAEKKLSDLKLSVTRMSQSELARRILACYYLNWKSTSTDDVDMSIGDFTEDASVDFHPKNTDYNTKADVYIYNDLMEHDILDCSVTYTDNGILNFISVQQPDSKSKDFNLFSQEVNVCLKDIKEDAIH